MKKSIILFFLVSLSLFSKPLPVQIIGNKAIDERAIYSALGFKKPSFLEFWKKSISVEPKKFKTLLPALKNFYKSNGFYRVKIDYYIKTDRIEVVIKEGEPVIIADIAFNSKLDIRGLVPFKKGEIFNAKKFVQSKKEIREFYAKNSFCNAILDAKAYIDIEQNRAYLIYNVEPKGICYFGKISISTPPKLDADIIKSLLLFKEGDKYSTELIKLSYNDIYANEAVERVVINDSQYKGNKVPVNINISLYPKPIRVSAGVGFSSDEGANLQFGIRHRNFPKNLKTVALESKYTQIRRFVKLNYEMPLRNRNRFAAELGFQDENYDGYDEKSIASKVVLKHILWPLQLQESIIIEHKNTVNSLDEINFPNGKLLISSLSSEISIDKRDSLLDPKKGYKLSAYLAGSIKSLISDASYYKIALSAINHLPIAESTLSARVKLGALKSIQGHIPPSYRFYAGGMSSNRAFKYRELGAKNSLGNSIGAFSILEGSLEYRFFISQSFRGVVFSDITYVGQNVTPDFNRVFLGIGPGIRFLSPIGPIAFDIGFNAQKLSSFSIHFHIGELF